MCCSPEDEETGLIISHGSMAFEELPASLLFLHLTPFTRYLFGGYDCCKGSHRSGGFDPSARVSWTLSPDLAVNDGVC